MKNASDILEKHRPDLDRSYYIPGICSNGEMDDYMGILNAMAEYAKQERQHLEDKLNEANDLIASLQGQIIDKDLHLKSLQETHTLVSNKSLSELNAAARKHGIRIEIYDNDKIDIVNT